MSDPVILPATLEIAALQPAGTTVCETAKMFELTSGAFTMPVLNGTANIDVCNSTFYGIGAWVWLAGAGKLKVTARGSNTQITLQNTDVPGNAAGGTVIGAGAVMVQCVEPSSERWLEGSAVWDPAEIADGDEEAQEITVTGAALGDFVVVSFSLDVTDLTLTADVTAASTVTAVLANNTGGAIDLASGTVRARVMPM